MKPLSDAYLALITATLASAQTSIITVDCDMLRALVAEVHAARARARPRCYSCWDPMPVGSTGHECPKCYNRYWGVENE
jgi:hypothetical protein